MNAYTNFDSAGPLPAPAPASTSAPRPAPVPAARAADDARWEIRTGASIVAMFIAVFGGWAALAPLGAAASAPGVVKVSGERKAIQSLTGGIISALPIAEGDHVAAGQVVVRFAADETRGAARALTSRVVGLEAQIARLDAQRTGSATVIPPADFVDLAPEDRAESAHALTVEQHALDTVRAAAAAQRATLRERIGQIRAQIAGYDIKRQALETQGMINDQQLVSVERLAAQGYAPQSRVLALKQSGAGLSGDAGSAASEAAGLKSAAGEAEMQILQVDANLAQDTARQLRDAQAELDSVIPQWAAARAKLTQAALRAPVSGQVVALAIHTVGGVAAAGQVLMEVVPDDRSLVVEAQVAVADANEITIGQTARVRVTNLHGRQIPVLTGRVTRVSADALSDPKTGRPYYTASVAVPAAELDLLTQAANIRGIRPGTPVDVQVSLHSRSMLSYWLDPIEQLFSHSMREN